MAEIDYDLLADKITERILAKITPRFDTIDKANESIDRIVTATNSDLADDRKDIAHMKIATAASEQGVKELVDMVAKLSDKLREAVMFTISEELRNAPKQIAEKTKNGVTKTIDNFLQNNKKHVTIKKKKRFFFF